MLQVWCVGASGSGSLGWNEFGVSNLEMFSLPAVDGNTNKVLGTRSRTSTYLVLPYHLTYLTLLRYSLAGTKVCIDKVPKVRYIMTCVVF